MSVDKNVNVDEILTDLARIIGKDPAEVWCQVYKGATQFYLRFHGIALVLSNESMKELLALAEKAQADVFVGEIPKTSHEKQGVQVTLGLGPVLVTRTKRDPL